LSDVGTGTGDVYLDGTQKVLLVVREVCKQMAVVSSDSMASFRSNLMLLLYLRRSEKKVHEYITSEGTDDREPTQYYILPLPAPLHSFFTQKFTKFR
jgi:hypothetical protein